ncbi:MAG: S46 family peptidase [Gemmataceae bacterium]|nr:S46 family peptidase [Gemmataceae bacterium]
MYLLNRPPRELLQKKYRFDLADAWLQRAMKASVRFNNGGSGGFVSPDGLTATNHHVGAGLIQKLSVGGKDYLRDGFYARTCAQELKCPDLELNVLQNITDVTERVQAAVKPGLTPAQAEAARRGAIARIEKESLAKTGLRSDVVTLYHGGLYHLYRYKKYTDVRLVFAPERAGASFGGDVDNFEYPRYCLDVCFFRAYENGAPAQTPDYFRWSTQGPKEGDLVFVSGHPGTTNRLETLARLKHRRDLTLPYTLRLLRQREALYQQVSEESPDQERMARTDLYSVANARKAYTGQYHGLLDPAIIARKEADEAALRQFVDADPKRRKRYGPAWQQIARAEEELAPFEVEYFLLERGDGFDSRLFRIARAIVRLTEEVVKDDADRLREYRSAALESLKFQLFSPAPIYPELERAKLAGSLAFLAEVLGGEHPVVVKALGGKGPAARAAELVAGSKLKDPAARRALVEGGREAAAKSSDTMIRFARLLDDAARALRKRHDELEEVERQAYANIAKARFERHGTSVPPDATFTLRLAFGVVKGYQVAGEEIPFATTFAGLYRRAEEQKYREPFTLPRRWLDGKGKVDLATPMNFVSTADTIGGNSGSPVLNRAGELVGLNFDRNRHGLIRNYVYTDEQARHVSVHCRAVLEALRRLYGADDLTRELTGGR